MCRCVDRGLTTGCALGLTGFNWGFDQVGNGVLTSSLYEVAFECDQGLD